MNIPYRKQYDSQGLQTNRITKESPHLHSEPNRTERRRSVRDHIGLTNNRGNRSVIIIPSTGRVHGYFRTVQVVGRKRIIHHVPKYK